MNHSASGTFWDRYGSLSPEERKLADSAFARLKEDPKYPSLHFKKIGRFWSARVTTTIRALAVESKEGLVWFWIGKHSEYDRIIRLQR